MTAALLIIGLLITCFIFVNIFNDKNFAESIIIGIVAFLFGHALVSYVLFLFDVYTPVLTCVGAAVIPLLFLIDLIIRKRIKLKKSINLNIAHMIIPILVALMLTPFVSKKNEYYGMGQDQGVYQSHVMALLGGDTKRINDFTEYYKVPEENKEDFTHRLEELKGADSAKQEVLDDTYPEDTSDSWTYIHGIPVFAAFMTSWASVFGLTNMQGIQTVFYVLALLLTYLSARNIGVKTYAAILAEIAVGLSPLVIWVGKSALTEMFLAVIMLTFLYLLSEDRDELNKLSIVPVIVFACYHVSFITIVPAFACVYAMQYYLTRRKYFAFQLVSLTVIYVASFWANVIIQPVYTLKNFYFFLYSSEHIENATILVPRFVWITAGILLMASGIWLIVSIIIKKPSIKKMTSSAGYKITMRILLMAPVALVLFNIYRRKEEDLSYIKSLIFNLKISTLSQFGFNCCLILFVVALVRIFIRPGSLFRSLPSVTLSVMFFYCILIFSALIRLTIPSLYYWGRYLVPFIPIGIIMVLYICQELHPVFVTITFALSMGLCIRADIFLKDALDDTKIEWVPLTKLTDEIGDNDAVLMTDDSRIVMWMPLRYMTKADVYPQFSDIACQADALLNDYEDVYIVSFHELPYDEDLVTPVYEGRTIYIPDPPLDVRQKEIFPCDFDKERQSVYLYRINRDHEDKHTPDRLSYTIEENYFSYRGLGNYEGLMAWSHEDKVELDCYLEKKSYRMTVDLAFALPLGQIELDRMDVKVYVNGKYVDSFSINENSNYDEYTISIDKSYIQDGKNTITLDGATWDVSTFNPNDNRIVGYPLESIIFQES